MGINLEVLGEVTTLAAKGSSGKTPQAGQVVTCHFVISLMDTTKVSDTRDEHGDTAGEPLRLKVGQGSVIKGIDQALQKIRVGQIVRVVISPDLAYGSRGFYPSIPANSTLIVDIELLACE